MKNMIRALIILICLILPTNSLAKEYQLGDIQIQEVVKLLNEQTNKLHSKYRPVLEKAEKKENDIYATWAMDEYNNTLSHLQTIMAVSNHYLGALYNLETKGGTPDQKELILGMFSSYLENIGIPKIDDEILYRLDIVDGMFKKHADFDTSEVGEVVKIVNELKSRLSAVVAQYNS